MQFAPGRHLSQHLWIVTASCFIYQPGKEQEFQLSYCCQELRGWSCYYSNMVRDMDKREYDQLDSLSSSSNAEISRLSVVVKNLKERLESLELNQTEIMDKLNALGKE